jgi:predicted TIM-barrel fold metal-dependent hydrolase
MSEAKERFPDWARDTRMPVPPPPPLSCDCQFHVYENPRIYPPKWKINHELPDATFADSQKMLRALGFSRGVFVHASVYDTDFRMIEDALRGLADRSGVRGVVVVNDDASDRQLQRLSDLGVCGARFHIAKRYEAQSKSSVARTLERLRALGWHARLHLDPPELLEYSDVFDKVDDIQLVIDHLGRVDFSKGPDQPIMRWIVERLKRPNWWMLVSNGNRLSAMEEGWDDAIPFARTFIEAAPDRMIWSTDWPHVRWRKKRMMNDAEEVELLYRYVDHDPSMIRKILVENPARLHGFPPG